MFRTIINPNATTTGSVNCERICESCPTYISSKNGVNRNTPTTHKFFNLIKISFFKSFII